MAKPARSTAEAQTLDRGAPSRAPASTKDKPVSLADKQRRIAEMLQDIRSGIDELSRSAEARRGRHV